MGMWRRRLSSCRIEVLRTQPVIANQSFHPSGVGELVPNVSVRIAQGLVHRPAIASHYIGHTRIQVTIHRRGKRGTPQKGFTSAFLYPFVHNLNAERRSLVWYIQVQG